MALRPWYLIILLLIGGSVRAQSTFSEIVGGLDHDEAFGCVSTADNCSVITGTTHASDPGGFPDAFVMKVDTTGAIVWQLVVGNPDRDDVFRKVIQTTTGDLVVIGETGGFFSIPQQIMIARITPAGSIVWCKRYPATTWGEGYDIVETSSGNLVCTGSVVQGMNVYLRLLEVDPAGVPVWNKIYDTPSDTQAATDLIHTHDGGYLLIGVVNVSAGVNAGFALKVDALGNVVWYRRYFSPLNFTHLYSGYAQQNGQTGYVLVGWYEDGSTPSSQLLIIGIDQLGALAWARAVDHAQANEVIHLPNAPTDAVIAGRIVGNDSSMLALGIDDIGNVTWTKLVDGDPTAAWENANAISINADGTLTLAGALLYGSPGIYDEAFIARTMTSGIVGACDHMIPDLMSFPVTVTEADASHTIAPLPAPSFDVVLTPGTPMDVVATFCQSNEINGPGASLADPSIIVWYDQHRIVFAPELVVSGTIVVISDALGRLERVEPFIQPQADISMLPPGMYNVQLWARDHMRYARIVKH